MQSETATTTTPAPAAPVRYTMHDRQLAWAQCELYSTRRAIDLLQKMSASGGPYMEHILTALLALQQREERLLAEIKSRGGLLMLIGAAA